MYSYKIIIRIPIVVLLCQPCCSLEQPTRVLNIVWCLGTETRVYRRVTRFLCTVLCFPGESWRNCRAPDERERTDQSRKRGKRENIQAQRHHFLLSTKQVSGESMRCTWCTYIRHNICAFIWGHRLKRNCRYGVWRPAFILTAGLLTAAIICWYIYSFQKSLWL